MTLTRKDGTYDLVWEVGRYDYSWEVFGVFKRSDGLFFFGEDSGCSCYLPWESFDVTDITAITPETYGQFADSLDEWVGRRDVTEGWSANYTDDKADIRAKAVNLKRDVSKAIGW